MQFFNIFSRALLKNGLNLGLFMANIVDLKIYAPSFAYTICPYVLNLPYKRLAMLFDKTAQY